MTIKKRPHRTEAQIDAAREKKADILKAELIAADRSRATEGFDFGPVDRKAPRSIPQYEDSDQGEIDGEDFDCATCGDPIEYMAEWCENDRCKARLNWEGVY